MKSLPLALVILAACAPATPAPPPAHTFAAGTLRGRVLLEGTRAPVGNAVVSIRASQRAVATGADGRFTFEALPAGAWGLDVSSATPVAGLRAGVFVLGATTGIDTGDLVLAAPGAVEVTVVNGLTAVAGARVALAMSAEQTSDEQGHAHFAAVVPGEHTVAVQLATGGSVWRVPVTVSGGRPNALTIDTATGGEATAHVSGRLAGQTPTPVMFLEGFLPAVTASPDPQGAFTIDVPAGIYRVVARVEGRSVQVDHVPLVGASLLPDLLLVDDGARSCGAGARAGDVDGDGIADGDEPEACRCDATGSTDADQDGLCDDIDRDDDGDGVPDVADACPLDPHDACACVATDEVCDGLDNDCDGKIDLNLVPPPCSEPDRGVCAGATAARTCGGVSGWSACDYGPGYEPDGEVSCDGLDNDCDGNIDLDLAPPPCAEPDQGVCAGATAARTCDGLSGWSACDDGPAYEPDGEVSCDGLDNDCDGEVDVDLAPPPCDAPDRGVCAGASDLRTCDGPSGWGACDYGPAYEAGDEVTCDGLDNDCDGTADESLTLNACGGCQSLAGVPGEACDDGLHPGACGTWACAGAESVSCAGDDSQDEVCNGLDDDCDGTPDNDLTPPACALPDRGVCSGTSAARTCQGVAGWTACDYGPDWEPEPETRRDGLDNDCDGAVDEGLVPGSLVWAGGAASGTTSNLVPFGFATLPGGASVVVGYFQGTLTLGAGTPSATTLTGPGTGVDGFLARFEADGFLGWARDIGGPETFAEALGVWADGSILVGGYYHSNTTVGDATDPLKATYSTGTQNQGFLARFQPNGTLSWVQQFGTAGTSEQINGLATASDGSFYATGNFQTGSTLGTAPAPVATLTSSGAYDIFVAHFLANGSLDWARTVGGSQSDTQSVVAVVEGTAVYLGHTWQVDVTYDRGGPGQVSFSNTFTSQLGLARFDEDGTFRWAQVAAGNGIKLPTAIAGAPDGSVTMVGQFRSSASPYLTFGAGGATPVVLQAADTSGDWFVARYALDGTLIYARKAGGPLGGDQPMGLVVAPDGRAVVAGYYNRAATFGPGEPGQVQLTSAGGGDAVVAGFAPGGDLEWLRTAGGTGSDEAYGIGTLPSGGWLLLGKFTASAVFGKGEPNETTLVPASTNDLFLARLAK